mgnify:CR=1 FL=1
MIQRLFETHVAVRDLERSMKFYETVIGLELARFEPERRVAFYWVGGHNVSMLGLWERSEGSIESNHFAMQVALEDFSTMTTKLDQHGIETYNFLNDGTKRPMVFAWMPALSIYFRDPDGHELEYIAPLPGPGDLEAGIITFDQWQATSK